MKFNYKTLKFWSKIIESWKKNWHLLKREYKEIKLSLNKKFKKRFNDITITLRKYKSWYLNLKQD